MSLVHPIDALLEAELRIEGQLVAASNTTLRCHVGETGQRAIYKPVRGERPLWDFPDGTLAGRELATHDLCVALGWTLVPPTVLRDGPLGPGMVQWWIEEAPAARPLVDLLPADADLAGWLVVLQAVDQDDQPVYLVHADDPDLRAIALLDVVVNNADRKAGHLLQPVAPGAGTVLGVDHGLSFHTEPKLRTALWGWAGAELTDTERSDLHRLLDLLDADVGEHLRTLVLPAEVAACRRRTLELLEAGCFPEPPVDRTPIPWPVF